MTHSAEFVPETEIEVLDPTLLTNNDTVVYLAESEIQDVRDAMSVSATTKDPFSRVNRSDKLPRKFQQKINRLEKRLEGTDGAKSKYVDPELVTGYSLFNVVVPPYDLDALALLYDESYILRAVVDARTMNTVGLGMHWVPTTKATKQIEKASVDEEKAAALRTKHQKEKDKLTELFENFNEEETIIETLIKVWIDLLTLGNAYLEVGRTVGGKVGYVGHIPANLVRVRRPRDGFVQQANHEYVFFRNFGDKTTVDPINGDPNPNEILHFKLYSPTNNWYGVPPSVSALSAIVGDKFAKEFNIDYFENKAIPRYAIILKGVKLSAKSKTELINYFRNEVKGKNHGTLVIPLPATIGNQSEADVKFEALENDVQEASFDKYRKSNRDEVVTVYRTPPTKVAIFENANLAVSRDADKTFKSQVIGPDQKTAENRLNRIVKEFTDLFLVEFEQFDLIDDDTRSRINDRYLRTQVKTPNEVRQDIGVQPIPGGDQPLPYADPNLKYSAPAMTQNELRSLSSLEAMEGGDEKPPTPVEMMKLQQKAKDEGGAPPGNANSGTPSKSGEDSGKTTSNKDVVGTNAERGEKQDQGKERDRTGRGGQ